jgi:dynein heavy chain
VQLVQNELDVQKKTLVCTLLVINVHLRDVIGELLGQAVDTVTNFEWIKQLRFYMDAELLEVAIRQTGYSFCYSYEYLGNGQRLVMTPLTDKVYLTMTCALRLHFGCSISGPAGTGKTETVKDFAKSIGIQCLVFNC